MDFFVIVCIASIIEMVLGVYLFYPHVKALCDELNADDVDMSKDQSQELCQLTTESINGETAVPIVTA
jgi:hypothetical protein